ncbi:pantoate--beta-alanine ligase [Stackebrandtia soli]|uniref:pantoate--beta-alanine ligase n=1 Tax=Stackebrandtia soli TaxID=1892856 RepID=UPI0039E80082
MNTPPQVVTTIADLATARARLAGTVGFVPTMGSLHDGHTHNMRAALDRADHLVVSVFVNPLQFGPNEDFETYPRDLDADVALCAEAGAAIVFAPSVDEMYPAPQQIHVDPGPLGDILEGASRPGFFTGVLTVVAKLFGLVKPDFACFGEKDYQQLALVRRLVDELNLDVEIIGVPTVRDDNGLARSSRNVYLTEAGRYDDALAIPRAIDAAQRSADPLGAARAVLDATDGLRLDYLTVRALDLGDAPTSGPARLLIAAVVGTTRLIDNAPVHVGENDV